MEVRIDSETLDKLRVISDLFRQGADCFDRLHALLAELREPGGFTVAVDMDAEGRNTQHAQSH